MGTRSRIGVWNNGAVKSVYCHWDGYLSHNGKILLEHYDEAKSRTLVDLGDISSLRQDIGIKHAFSPFESNNPNLGQVLTHEEYESLFGNMTTFYGRDRGETGVEAMESADLNEFLEECDNCAAEYYYIMKDGVWYWGTTHGNLVHSHTLNVLTPDLVREEETV